MMGYSINDKMAVSGSGKTKTAKAKDETMLEDTQDFYNLEGDNY